MTTKPLIVHEFYSSNAGQMTVSVYADRIIMQDFMSRDWTAISISQLDELIDFLNNSKKLLVLV